MPRPLTILHVFDFYLPNTMNWAFQLMQHTPGVEQWIAAPWILNDQFPLSDARYLRGGIQKMLGLSPKHELDFHHLSNNLIRLEHRLPIYRHWLASILKNNPPDIIHAHFGPVACHYLKLANELNIPMLASFYGYDFLKVPTRKPNYSKQYASLFQSAGKISSPGPGSAEFLMNAACPEEKIAIIPLGILLKRFPFSPKKKKPGALKLLQMATITEKKGYMDTLQAMNLALKSRSGIELTIVGERQNLELVKQMEKYIADNNMKASVNWLNPVSYKDVPSLLAKYDVFIHPSRKSRDGDVEGAPVCILEAQATGLSVISTIHADIPFQVKHNETGLLTKEGNPEALAKSILRFYDMSDAEFASFSQAARHHVEEHYNVKAVGINLLELYKSMLQTSNFPK